MKETSINHIDGDLICTISTAETAIKHRLMKLKAENEDVEIIAENSDGSILAHLPWGWITIKPPRRLKLTEAQRKARAERLRKCKKE